MKAGWHWRKFGDVCDLKKGKRPVLRESRGTDDKPYLVAKYLRGAEPTEFASVNDKNSVLVAPNEIIIICDGSNSGETFMGFEGVLSSTMARLAHGDDTDNRFMMHFLASLFEKFNSAKTGAAIPHLDLTALREELLPIPPILEQRRIVAILDDSFNSIATAAANAERNLQNARALFASYLESAFTNPGKGWVKKPLSELCDIKHGFAFEGKYFSNEGDYVLLTPGNVYEHGGYRDRGDKQKYYTGEIPRDYLLSKGDLLVAMTEQAAGLLGSPILVPESDRFLHNQRLGLVMKKPGVAWTNEFFFHAFNTRNVRRAIHYSASGVKVRHTSPTKIGQVVVAFPTSIAEQVRIVATLESISDGTRRLESLYRQKLSALDALKRSFLHLAYSGQL